jgi:dienelactone hydrolase
MELVIDSAGVELTAVLANPPAVAPARGLVLCHAAPGSSKEALATASSSYAELAVSLSLASGWSVLSVDFRAPRAGAPVLADWMTDLRSGVGHLRSIDTIDGVWLAGFSVAGALALCVAGEDESIRGVATFGAPAEFDGSGPDAAVAQPLQSVSKVPPRPLLIVHGDSDDVVNVSDARALADAAGGEVELRILAGGGHGLRHDPRATAVLEGWLDRQNS